MNKIHVICDARLVEPYSIAISRVYSLGIIKGWHVLKASTDDDYIQVAFPIDLYREYFDSSPVKGKMLETIPGMGKIIDNLIIVDIKDLSL